MKNDQELGDCKLDKIAIDHLQQKLQPPLIASMRRVEFRVIWGGGGGGVGKYFRKFGKCGEMLKQKNPKISSA